MANAEKTKRETPLRSNKTRSDRSNRVKKREFRTANGVLGDNSLTSVTNDERPNENNQRNLSLKHDDDDDNTTTSEVVESIPVSNTSVSTRFICKVCGNTFDDQDLLNEHTSKLHPPKREVTASQIIEQVFEGKLNFPKTKAELVKYVEENKEKESITPDVIDILRNIPDRRYNDVADLVLGLGQQRGSTVS
jgi:Protein of unknown function (DUF2795)